MKSGKNSESSGLPPEKWPLEAKSLKDNVIFHNSYATHLILNYSISDAWRLAIRDAGLPPMEVSSTTRNKVKDSIIIGRAMGALRRGGVDEDSLAAPFQTRLQGHLDKLAYLRDLAVGEGLIGQAITAEIARGKVQGFYALDKASSPLENGVVNPSDMSDADILSAIKRVASQTAQPVSFSDTERRQIEEVSGVEVDFESIEGSYREADESGERGTHPGSDGEGSGT
jgi:hypothetical protein